MEQGSHCFVLTGGIGSGKSHVAALLEERGWLVIDADRIGHEVLEPGGAAFDAVVQRWPEVVKDGRIDRRALGRLVFGSQGGLAELEAYTHPAIRAAIASRIDEAKGPTVLEIPILNDWMTGWPRVVVDAPDHVRRLRLSGRGMDAGEIAERMAAQPSREEWCRAADFVVDNGTTEDLEPELDRLEGWLAGKVG